MRLIRARAPGGMGVRERFRQEGLSPRSWSDPPGATYAWHDLGVECVEASR